MHIWNDNKHSIHLDIVKENWTNLSGTGFDKMEISDLNVEGFEKVVEISLKISADIQSVIIRGYF